MPDRYRRLSFRVEDDSDQLAAALWECGTLGVELPGDPREPLVAYFLAGGEPCRVDWSRFGAHLLASEGFAEQDWLAVYRKSARPLELGRRLLVDPREPGEDPVVPVGRRLLTIPARTAFGTGSHASTRLVVDHLERLDLAGLRVLDVGSGSGVLAFAALIFGAEVVVGVELDLEAALVAAENRTLNDIFPSLVAGRVGTLRAGAGFHLAMVNVLPERVAGDLTAIRDRLLPGGSAIFSGILTERLATVRADLCRAGFRLGEHFEREEWSALLVHRHDR